MTVSTPQAAPPKSALTTRLIIAAVIIAGLIAAGYAAGLQNYLSTDVLDQFSGWIAENTLTAAIIFVVIYAALVAISFPGATILTIGGGYLFGQWIGTASVVLAATLGATAIFAIAKWVFKDAFADKAGGFLAKMEKGFRNNELNYMFLLRLVPAFPFAGVNIGAGVLGVSLRNYLIGTFFGIIPGSFVYVSIGVAIREGAATLEDAGLLAVFTQPQVYVPFIGLGLLALLPILLGKGKSADEAASTEGSSNDQ